MAWLLGHLSKCVLRPDTTVQTHRHPCSSQATLPPASGPLHFWQLSARLASLAFGTEHSERRPPGRNAPPLPCLLFVMFLMVHLSSLDSSIARICLADCVLSYRMPFSFKSYRKTFPKFSGSDRTSLFDLFLGL